MPRETAVDKSEMLPGRVLITGASGGVGRATALLFARRGWQVVASGRDSARLNQLVDQYRAGSGSGSIQFLACDLADPQAGQEIIQQTVQLTGGLDLLVHAAAVAVQGPFSQTTPEQFNQTVDLNLRGTYFLLQAAYRQMMEQAAGTLICISSLAAVDPFTGFSVYGSSKAWLDLLVRAIADEGRPHGIRAFSIRPGAVETPMLRGLFPDFPAEQTVSPEAVAEVAWSLAGPAWKYSSGQALNVTAQ